MDVRPLLLTWLLLAAITSTSPVDVTSTSSLTAAWAAQVTSSRHSLAALTQL